MTKTGSGPSLAWVDKAECQHATKLFYTDMPSNVVERWRLLAEQRDFCAECPVFDECLEYSYEHYADTQFLTMAGFDEQMRRELIVGKRKYADWRADWESGKPFNLTTGPACAKHKKLRHLRDDLYICADCQHTVKKRVRSD